MALSAAHEDEPGVRRDDLAVPCQITEGGEDDSENRIVVQPFIDDKNRDKNKNTSESEGCKIFSLHDLHEDLWKWSVIENNILS